MSPPDDAVTYWRIGRGYWRQTRIPGGVSWAPWDPGVYASQQTGERIGVMDSDNAELFYDEGYEARIHSFRPNKTADSYTLTVARTWEGLTRAQCLGLLQAEYTFEGMLLAKAIEVGAAHGVTPASLTPPPPPPAGWPQEPA